MTDEDDLRTFRKLIDACGLICLAVVLLLVPATGWSRERVLRCNQEGVNGVQRSMGTLNPSDRSSVVAAFAVEECLKALPFVELFTVPEAATTSAEARKAIIRFAAEDWKKVCPAGTRVLAGLGGTDDAGALRTIYRECGFGQLELMEEHVFAGPREQGPVPFVLGRLAGMMLGKGLVEQGAEKGQVRVLIHLLAKDPPVAPDIMETVLRNSVPRPRMGQKVKKKWVAAQSAKQEPAPQADVPVEPVTSGANRAGRVVIGGADAMVMGSVQKEEIQIALEGAERALRSCHQAALNKVPGLKGTVAVRFMIASTGRVATANLRNSSVENRALEQCVVSVVKKRLFPRPKGGGVAVIIYPFTFAIAPE